MEDRKSFAFYPEYYEAVRDLPKSQCLKALKAIIKFSLYGDTELLHETGKHTKAYKAFMSVMPIMKDERRRSAEGRHCAEYRLWRSTVFERDGYQCQICNAKGGKLNAHHIESYAHHPCLRYEPDNGVTLCEECHKFVHRELRKGVEFEWHG